MCRPCPQGMLAGGRLRRVMEKTTCWRMKPNGLEKQRCESCVAKVSRRRMCGRSRPCISESRRRRMARWRWLTKQTIVKHITKDLRQLGCVKCMDETSKKVLKEGWQKELAQTDHLPDRPSARWTVRAGQIRPNLARGMNRPGLRS